MYLKANKQAEKSLGGGWRFFQQKSKLQKASYYEEVKSWANAGAAYIKYAHCRKSKTTTSTDGDYEAALRYVDAAQCYKKEAIACLEQAATSFCEMGLNGSAALRYQEIAEMYVSLLDFEKAEEFFGKAAELFTEPMSRDRSKRRAAGCANRIITE
ncbi:hypothetical protein ACLB2K_009146 [Fragaria x ananassa]